MIENFDISQIALWINYKAANLLFSNQNSMNEFVVIQSLSMDEFLQKYCICGSISSLNSYCICDNISWLDIWKWNNADLSEHTTDRDYRAKNQIHPTQYHKRRLLDTIDFEPYLSALLSTVRRVANEHKIVVYSKRKSAARQVISSRRSQYTGVFKNGDNWQALIAINKKKTYIGTYATELEAAKVFDFYSLLLNNITATTNFDYSKRLVVEMVENFIANDRKYVL